MSFSKEKNVKNGLKSFEDQQLDAEALKHLVGGNGGETPPEDEEDPNGIISDDIILP